MKGYRPKMIRLLVFEGSLSDLGDVAHCRRSISDGDPSHLSLPELRKCLHLLKLGMWASWSFCLEEDYDIVTRILLYSFGLVIVVELFPSRPRVFGQYPRTPSKWIRTYP